MATLPYSVLPANACAAASHPSAELTVAQPLASHDAPLENSW